MFNAKKFIKTDEELSIMREGGKILTNIVKELELEIKEGNTSNEVNKLAFKLCKKFKVKPAFLNYLGSFPGTICANLNDTVVHGVPNNQKFKEGDIFGLDMGVVFKGYNLDMSITYIIGSASNPIQEFVNKTYNSMMSGINEAIQGKRVGDICFAMNNNYLSDEFSLMQDFVGHGIGKNLHEPPEIPGIGMQKGEGMKLKAGMVVAIESISVLGPNNDYKISTLDNWTVKTANRELSALFEHTVIIGESSAEIITEI